MNNVERKTGAGAAPALKSLGRPQARGAVLL